MQQVGRLSERGRIASGKSLCSLQQLSPVHLCPSAVDATKSGQGEKMCFASGKSRFAPPSNKSHLFLCVHGQLMQQVLRLRECASLAASLCSLAPPSTTQLFLCVHRPLMQQVVRLGKYASQAALCSLRLSLPLAVSVGNCRDNLARLRECVWAPRGKSLFKFAPSLSLLHCVHRERV